MLFLLPMFLCNQFCGANVNYENINDAFLLDKHHFATPLCTNPKYWY